MVWQKCGIILIVTKIYNHEEIKISVAKNKPNSIRIFVIFRTSSFWNSIESDLVFFFTLSLFLWRFFPVFTVRKLFRYFHKVALTYCGNMSLSIKPSVCSYLRVHAIHFSIAHLAAPTFYISDSFFCTFN